MFSGWGKKVEAKATYIATYISPHFNERGMLVPYYDCLFVCLIYLFIGGKAMKRPGNPLICFSFVSRFLLLAYDHSSLRNSWLQKCFRMTQKSKAEGFRLHLSTERERETVSELSQVIYVKNKTKLDKSQSSDITILNVQYSISFNKHDRHILINNIYIPNIFPLLGIS